MSVMPWAATRVRRRSAAARLAVLERAHRRLARRELSRPEQVQRVREALEHRLLDLDVPREDDERLAGGEEVVDPRERGVELAARGEPLQRAELREPLGAQRGGDLRVRARERSSGCSRSQATTSSSASLYSRALSSATGTTTWRLAGSCGSTSLFSRRTKQRRRRCQCSRSSVSGPGTAP